MLDANNFIAVFHGTCSIYYYFVNLLVYLVNKLNVVDMCG